MNMELDPETMRDEMAMWVRKALKLTLKTQVGSQFELKTKLTEEQFNQLTNICENNRKAHFLEGNLVEIKSRSEELS
jgi:hypothetical protein